MGILFSKSSPSCTKQKYWTRGRTRFNEFFPNNIFEQSCGSGEGIFLGLPDPDPISSSKNSKKNLDSYCCVSLSLWFFIFEKWCKCMFTLRIRIHNTEPSSKYNIISEGCKNGKAVWGVGGVKYLADEDLTDVRRLVEGLAVDGLLALDDGGEVHQPAREMPAVKLDSSLPETDNCVCKRCNLQARLWIRIQGKTKRTLKK